MQAPHFALQATAVGTSCRPLEGQGLLRSLLAGNQCSFWNVTQLPKVHLLLSVLPLCVRSLIHSFIHSFHNCCTASQSQVLFPG